jgi:hypothetical protein
MKILTIALLFSLHILTYAQITINGDLSESQYVTVATKQNSNAGFGPNIDVSKIVYYPDFSNNLLYIGVESKLNTTSNDGIGLWINISGSGAPAGASAGTSLSVSGGGHYISGNGGSNPNFKADFEVDYMFAFNPGSSSTNCYLDAASRVGTPSHTYLGNCGQSGSPIDYSTTGTVFSSGHTITFAFNNSGTSNKGFEIKIPFGAIGATASMNISLFAFVVSSTAFFSDVTVPGNRTGGNPGFDPDFGSLSGGPYHSSNYPLPVELASFSANVKSGYVELSWLTATELNNYGFEIERSIDKTNWQKLDFIAGYGTSNSPKLYSYIDRKPFNGVSYYRLKQIDNDGSSHYSREVEVELTTVLHFKLEQNHPNPFNPSTKISWQSPISGHQSLKVFDLIGNEITTLVNEFREAGSYEIEFNAAQYPGLSSGMYFYKLQIGQFSQVKKMILTK